MLIEFIQSAFRARKRNVREWSKMSLQWDGRRPVWSVSRDVEASAVKTHLPIVGKHGREVIEKLKSRCTFRSLFQTRKCGFVVQSLDEGPRPCVKVAPSLALRLFWVCWCIETFSGDGPKLRHLSRDLNSDRFQIFPPILSRNSFRFLLFLTFFCN